MKVKKFKELTKDELDFIANIHSNYWVNFNPLMDVKDAYIKFTTIYNNDELPLGIVLYNDEDKIVGFCTLRIENLEKYPKLTPWICSVMILEEYRNQGYGRALIHSAIDILKELGYKQAYLWTDQAPEFYEKLGFTYLQKIEKPQGGEGKLYYKEI